MKGRQQRNNTKAIGSDKEAYQESQIRLSTRAWLLIQGWISKNLFWDFSQGASVCSHDLPYRVKHNEEKISVALVDPHYFHVHCFLISFQVNWGRTNPAPQTSGTEWHDPYKHHVHQPMRAKGKRESLSRLKKRPIFSCLILLIKLISRQWIYLMLKQLYLIKLKSHSKNQDVSKI